MPSASSEKDTLYPGAVIKGDCKPLCGILEPKPRSFATQVLFTAELSIKHHNTHILLERNLYSRITSHFLGK